MSLTAVLHIAESFSYGGTEKTMQILCKSLSQRKNFQVHAGAWSAGGGREEWTKRHVPHVISFHRDPQKLRAYIELYKIKIVHIHRSQNRMLEVLTALKGLNDLLIIETNAFGKITDSSLESLVSIRAFVSVFCAKRFQERHFQFAKEKFLQSHVVLYNPIDPDEFPKYTDEQILSYKKSLGISVEDSVLSRVGRADESKFGDMCVLMMRFLVKKNPHVRLVLQSAPPYIHKYIRRHKLQRNIIILPETVDTHQLGLLYASTDVVVHSSLIGESFGCSLAEGMFYHKPIVVNTTPYFDNAQIELVDNGKTGYVVDNPRSFAEAVHHLLLNNTVRTEYGSSAYQKVMQSYAVDVVVSQLEIVYKRMIDGLSVSDLFPYKAFLAFDEREKSLFATRPYIYEYYRLRNIVQKRYYAFRKMFYQ